MRRPLVAVLVCLALLLVFPAPPARAQGYVYAWSVTATGSTTVTTTTETIGCTLNNLTTRFAGLTVRLGGLLEVTSGGSTTALTLRIRRGTAITGTLVGVANAITTTAGNTVAIPKQGEDSPGEVAGQSYVLTVQQTGAVANGTIVFCELWAFVY